MCLTIVRVPTVGAPSAPADCDDVVEVDPEDVTMTNFILAWTSRLTSTRKRMSSPGRWVDDIEDAE
jgi:hypothetical protein